MLWFTPVCTHMLITHSLPHPTPRSTTAGPHPPCHGLPHPTPRRPQQPQSTAGPQPPTPTVPWPRSLPGCSRAPRSARPGSCRRPARRSLQRAPPCGWRHGAGPGSPRWGSWSWLWGVGGGGGGGRGEHREVSKGLSGGTQWRNWCWSRILVGWGAPSGKKGAVVAHNGGGGGVLVLAVGRRHAACTCDAPTPLKTTPTHNQPSPPLLTRCAVQLHQLDVIGARRLLRVVVVAQEDLLVLVAQLAPPALGLLVPEHAPVKEEVGGGAEGEGWGGSSRQGEEGEAQGCVSNRPPCLWRGGPTNSPVQCIQHPQQLPPAAHYHPASCKTHAVHSTTTHQSPPSPPFPQNTPTPPPTHL